MYVDTDGAKLPGNLQHLETILADRQALALLEKSILGTLLTQKYLAVEQPRFIPQSFSLRLILSIIFSYWLDKFVYIIQKPLS